MPARWLDSVKRNLYHYYRLYNPNPTAVNLGGYYLTDNLGNPTKFAIPTNTIIAGRGFLLVWADEDGSQNAPTNADLHANFKLSNEGEAIGLFAPDGISPQHTVTFGAQYPNVSQGLFPDGVVAGGSVFMTNWTPRLPNRVGGPPAPRIQSLDFTGSVLRFTIDAIAGRSYVVEYVDELAGSGWTVLGPVHLARGDTLAVEVPIGLEPQRFYRVRLQ